MESSRQSRVRGSPRAPVLLFNVSNMSADTAAECTMRRLRLAAGRRSARAGRMVGGISSGTRIGDLLVTDPEVAESLTPPRRRPGLSQLLEHGRALARLRIGSGRAAVVMAIGLLLYERPGRRLWRRAQRARQRDGTAGFSAWPTSSTDRHQRNIGKFAAPLVFGAVALALSIPATFFVFACASACWARRWRATWPRSGGAWSPPPTARRGNKISR